MVMMIDRGTQVVDRVDYGKLLTENKTIQEMAQQRVAFEEANVDDGLLRYYSADGDIAEISREAQDRSGAQPLAERFTAYPDRAEAVNADTEVSGSLSLQELRTHFAEGRISRAEYRRELESRGVGEKTEEDSDDWVVEENEELYEDPVDWDRLLNLYNRKDALSR